MTSLAIQRVCRISCLLFGVSRFLVAATLGLLTAPGSGHAAGTVVCWGSNGQGQTNIPSGLSNSVAIAAGGNHCLALTADCNVVGWGWNISGQATPPVGLSNVVAIAAGGYHSLALKTDGLVVGWGRSDEGQTVAPSGLNNVVAISGGLYYSLALKADGTVAAWGLNDSGQTNVPVGLSNVVAIAGGYNHSLALKADGTVAAWGLNDSGQTNVPVGLTNAVAIAGGGMHSLALKADGMVVGWGNNGYGQTNVPSELSNVVAIAAGWGHSLALTAEGQVVGWGLNDAGQTVAPIGLSNAVAIAGGTRHSLALHTAVFASMSLTLASQGVGTITKVPDKALYTWGEKATLVATPGRWHVFSGWTDGNTNNPRTVTIGESNAYTAVFTSTTLLDTVTVGGVSRLAPVGMPAVVVDGVFILTPSASARGSALVTLSSTFPGGWLFYTLDGSDPAASGVFYSGQFTVGKASLLRTIAYNSDFKQTVAGDPVSIVILPTLTGLTDGGGSVAIEPPAGDYYSNSLAVVTATPAPGWSFLQSLGDAAGTSPAVSVSMTRNKTVRAVFGTALNTTVVGGGSIVTSPVSQWYPYGSQVRLTAVPATGNYLAFWANAAAGQTNNPLIFTVTNANPTVTAVFASFGGTQTNALTVIPDGRGQVTLMPPGNRFPLNTNVVLQATPDLGQEFLGWTGAVSGSENPLVVTMNSNKVITASFTKRPWLYGEGNPDLLRQDGFRLTLTGEFGVAYQIIGSTDWSGWTLLGTVTNDWGTVQFTDGAGTNLPQRLYRAMQDSP
jgi:hypothetical protein